MIALDRLGTNIRPLRVVKPNRNETCFVELEEWIARSVDLDLTHWTVSKVLDQF